MMLFTIKLYSFIGISLFSFINKQNLIFFRILNHHIFSILHKRFNPIIDDISTYECMLKKSFCYQFLSEFKTSKKCIKILTTFNYLFLNAQCPPYTEGKNNSRTIIVLILK